MRLETDVIAESGPESVYLLETDHENDKSKQVMDVPPGLEYRDEERVAIDWTKCAHCGAFGNEESNLPCASCAQPVCGKCRTLED